MFSGFRSQWMMLTSGRESSSSARSSCVENLRIRFKLTPLNLLKHMGQNRCKVHKGSKQSDTDLVFRSSS